MRYLHPVAASERFIAKGVYRVYHNNVLDPDTRAEEWTQHTVLGGGVLTRIDQQLKKSHNPDPFIGPRQTSEVHGLLEDIHTTILVEILENTAGQIERLNVREWNKNIQRHTTNTVRADYIFFPEYVQITSQHDEEQTIHSEIPYSDATIILNLNNQFIMPIGPTFCRLKSLQETDNAFYFIPDWHSHRARMEPVNVKELAQSVPVPSPIKLGNKTYNTQKYSFEDTDIFINESCIMMLLEAEVPSVINSKVILTEYAHI